MSVIRFLLSNGADSSLLDNANETARDVAVRFRQLSAITLLSHNAGTASRSFYTVITRSKPTCFSDQP